MSITAAAATLNRTIWILWLQGFEHAPWIVRSVVESWRLHNPTWTVQLLSMRNIGEFIDRADAPYLFDESQSAAISRQAKSDIVRLTLLNRHGGVWADATMLCMRPLDEWVDDAVRAAGLWMYHGGHGSRGPASWFIVSKAGSDSYLISRWKRACDSYWTFRRGGAHTYLWMDELFYECLRSDEVFAQRWSTVPKIDCELWGQAHSLAHGNNRMHMPRNAGLVAMLSAAPSDLPYALKLWWDVWADNFPGDIDAPRSRACRDSNGFFVISRALQLGR